MENADIEELKDSSQHQSRIILSSESAKQLSQSLKEVANVYTDDDIEQTSIKEEAKTDENPDAKETPRHVIFSKSQLKHTDTTETVGLSVKEQTACSSNRKARL